MNEEVLNTEILACTCIKHWRCQNDNWGGGGEIFIYVHSA